MTVRRRRRQRWTNLVIGGHIAPSTGIVLCAQRQTSQLTFGTEGRLVVRPNDFADLLARTPIE